MDTKIFEELGLTNAEIKVYIQLLKFGSASAGPVIEKTGLQTSVVHRALNSLIGKALINYILEGKRKIYQATNPEVFIDFIDEKKRRFNEILPELKEEQLSAKNEEVASIYKGRKGLQEVYYKLINVKGEYLTFGGGEQVANFMGVSWWRNFHARRRANKLSSRQIFDKSVKHLGENIINMPLTNIKFLPQEFAQFQETVIVGDYVAVNVFTENAYSFLIKDKKVAEGYKKYFELLWNIAK
jgi:sugar-specific transcriptional regulator TrmB